jgi:chromosome segregation ATPase
MSEVSDYWRPELDKAYRNWNAAERALETARSTIAELEKRIGELTASEAHLLGEHRRQSELIDGWIDDSRKNLARAETAEQALTTERQRREEAEAAMLLHLKNLGQKYHLGEGLAAIRDFLSRHPSSLNELGNGRSE